MIFFNQISIQTHVFASRIGLCKRDPLRVNGDNNDYYPAAEIDVLDLRQFQYIRRLPAEDFKPVSVGLEESFAFNKKALTKGE